MSEQADTASSLAALEADAVRTMLEEEVLEDRIAEANAALLDHADAAGAVPREPEDEAMLLISARAEVDACFEMGVIERMWRGIEHLLPAERAAAMPESVVRVAVPTWITLPA